MFISANLRCWLMIQRNRFPTLAEIAPASASCGAANSIRLSGSTLIACERTGRVCYGMELEPLYVDIARMRWEAFSGERAKKVEEVK